jgi:hypothetical protein
MKKFFIGTLIVMSGLTGGYFFYEEYQKNQIEGIYYNNDGIVKAIKFENGYASFGWVFVKVTGAYEVKNNTIYVNTNTEFGTITFHIIDDYTIIGDGMLKGTYRKEGGPKTPNEIAADKAATREAEKALKEEEEKYK